MNGSRYRRTKTVPKKKRTSYFKKVSGGLEASFGTGGYWYVFWSQNYCNFFLFCNKNLGPDRNSMSTDPKHCFQPMLWILNVRYWLGRVTFDQAWKSILIFYDTDTGLVREISLFSGADATSAMSILNSQDILFIYYSTLLAIYRTDSKYCI